MAAKLREQFKINKWRDMAREHGVHEMDIIPIAFETSGRRGDLGDEFLRRMAQYRWLVSLGSFDRRALATAFGDNGKTQRDAPA